MPVIFCSVSQLFTIRASRKVKNQRGRRDGKSSARADVYEAGKAVSFCRRGRVAGSVDAAVLRLEGIEISTSPRREACGVKCTNFRRFEEKSAARGNFRGFDVLFAAPRKMRAFEAVCVKSREFCGFAVLSAALCKMREFEAVCGKSRRRRRLFIFVQLLIKTMPRRQFSKNYVAPAILWLAPPSINER